MCSIQIKHQVLLALIKTITSLLLLPMKKGCLYREKLGSPSEVTITGLQNPNFKLIRSQSCFLSNVLGQIFRILEALIFRVILTCDFPKTSTVPNFFHLCKAEVYVFVLNNILLCTCSEMLSYSGRNKIHWMEICIY